MNPPPGSIDADPLLTLAAARVLLVATDFDGTIADLVPTPDAATPDAACLRALERLTLCAATEVAVVSGRGLSDLAARLGEDHDFLVSGSHGESYAGPRPFSRWTPFETLPTPAADSHAQLQAVTARLESLAQQTGALLERKPAAIALHTRAMPPQSRAETEARAASVAADFPALRVRPGKHVVEISVGRTTKGDALRVLRRRTGATAVLYIGDDVTDDDAFSSLTPGDVSVRIGPGGSIVTLTLSDRAEVAPLLTRLADLRASHDDSQPQPALQAHSFLSDQRAVSVIDAAASVRWLAAPRPESSSLFSSLLGSDQHGHFTVRPAPDPSLDPSRSDASAAPPESLAAPTQHWEGDSLVLVTTWPGLIVRDYFDTSGGRAFQRAGRSDFLRVIECQRPTDIVFAPRMDFGRSVTRINARHGGLELDGAPDPVTLYAPGVEWSIEAAAGGHQTARARLESGSVVLELRLGTSSLRPAVLSEQTRRAATGKFWSAWASSLRPPDVHRALTLRSALALKSLIFGPTGAILAAGTTSLPEALGCSRNWDYRYCWPRDACLAALALLRLGNAGTAMRLLDYIGGIVERLDSPERFRPIYTVSATDLSPEAGIAELPGFGSSTPVRIGNAANAQTQLDVFGPVAHLVCELARAGNPISPDHWRLVKSMAAAVEARWREPDHGIWEFRSARAHHVHSKAMCWLTLVSASAVHEHLFDRPETRWLETASAIRDEVFARGFSQQLSAFVMHYESTDLDAAALLLGLIGFIEPSDPRYVSTVRAVEQGLRRGAGVYRYSLDDGMEGIEGAFNICTGWLIEALAAIGDAPAARALLHDFSRLAGPTGTFCEEFDPRRGMALGNLPQAYSHLAFINAALKVAALGP